MGGATWLVCGAMSLALFACGSDDGGTVVTDGGTSGSGGTGAGGSGGAATGGSGGDPSGGSGGDVTGGSGGGPSVCPYTTSSLSCDAACDNLKEVAAKCKDDPAVPTNIQAVLAAAAAGTGNGCKLTCAADSPSYVQQWSCFQAVPASADCTAIAGCTVGNCPGN